MTPREYAREQAAFLKRTREHYELSMSMAWHTAAFVGAAWAGKMPKLSEVLDQIRWSGAKSVPVKGALLADELGIAMRPISPEAIAALMRLKAERGN